MSQGSVVRVEAAVRWEICLSDEGLWVGLCKDLGLTVQSQTWLELMEDIATSLQLMVDDLAATGDLEAFIKEKGWLTSEELVGAEPTLDIPFIPHLVGRPDGFQASVPA